MNVLLRKRHTGLYFLDLGQWTPDPDTAHHFQSSAQAVLFAVRHHLEDLEVLLAYSDPSLDISFPVCIRLGPLPPDSPELPPP